MAKPLKKHLPFRKEMMISGILEKHPDGFTILQEFGLHWIGCHLNVFETLEEGILGHGMTKKTLKEILLALNKSFENYQLDLKEKGLVLTDKAAAKIIEIAHGENKKKYGLRVKILKNSKPEAMNYFMDFEKTPQKNDHVLEFQYGVRLFIDAVSFKRLKGSRIDYLETFEAAGFKIDQLQPHPFHNQGKPS